ncbi:hypothetical protein CBR_g6331 [Chara braunii]|uniref:SWIM-type domain-containing protein n=1 Tax=Chara braunii TaxID=69332 RepID=A0A388KJI6_CHABU|nr:hypothetical protein CBR_g6331 [Chara braunii]|eukprot:GBG70199.1 hypothetical protein CBR_g6331 [Chara braunii]
MEENDTIEILARGGGRERVRMPDQKHDSVGLWLVRMGMRRHRDTVKHARLRRGNRTRWERRDWTAGGGAQRGKREQDLSAGEVVDLLFEEVASHCAAMRSEIRMAEGLEGEDLSVKWHELERNNRGSADNHTTSATPSSSAGCSQVEMKKAGVDVPLAGLLSQDHLLKLSFFFNKNLDRALQILDAGAVEWVKGAPSGRSVFRIWGVKAKGVMHHHLCFPLSYCTCESFFYDVVARSESLCCKHQLAARLAQSLQMYKETQVSDLQLCKLLCGGD